MTAAPDVYAGPAFTGWRSWRILPFHRLGRPETLRLAASGTQGLPKLWEPGQPMVATCGLFETTHEAPWPDCSCGFYAYRTRDDAWAHLQTFLRSTNGDQAHGWAFGRASLWGRIVECEYGYRSQFAYPYALEVYADDSALAATVRGIYGVDVEAFEPLQAQTNDEDEDPAPRLIGRLGELEEKLELLEARFGVKRATPRSFWQAYSDLESKRRLEWLLFDQGRPVTAREFAQNLLADAVGGGTRGASPRWLLPPDTPAPTQQDICSIGWELYQLSLAREVRRLRGPGGRIFWCDRRADVPKGFTDVSPSEQNLDQDVALIQAIVRAGVVDRSAVATSAAIAALPAAIRPSRSQEWTIAFSRLAARRWATRPANRTWQATPLGVRVARQGHQLPFWRETTQGELLAEVRLAFEQAGGPITVSEITWRYDGRPGGHGVGQALLRLEQRGRLVRRGRDKHRRILWEPTNDKP